MFGCRAALLPARRQALDRIGRHRRVWREYRGNSTFAQSRENRLELTPWELIRWRLSRLSSLRRLTINAPNRSLDAPSTIANRRPFRSAAAASPSAASSSCCGSAASTREVRSAKSDLANAGSMLDDCLAAEASSSKLERSFPKTSTEATPGLPMSTAGIVAD